MISMLLYLFTFLSIAWAQYGQLGNMATDQLIESQKGLDSLIKKNMRNLVRQNFGYWIEDQKKSASRFGLSCEAEWDLLCTSETVADCSCLRYFEGELVRYSTADLLCTSNGGNLPVIHSELKNKFLFVYPDNFKLGAWIGLKNNNGEFIWVDGSDLSVTYWNPGAPTSDGDCVHYVGDEEVLDYVALDFKWKDSSCTEERPLVCEKKPTSTTTTITNSQSEITTTNSQSEMTTTNSQSEPTTAESQLVPTTTEKPDDCPEGYEKKCFYSSCYCYGVKNANYWGNAVSVCRSEGADMVSIHSQAENDYIRDLTKANNWIGCLRGSDKWGDGTLINYTNWRTTYDDHTLGYMNVAAYNGQWLGLSYFDIQLPFVCKT